MKLNLYVGPQHSLIQILNRDNEHKQMQLGTTKMRLELSDCIEFENRLQSRVEELNSILKESNNLRESDILINEIDTLEILSVIDTNNVTRIA